MEVAETSGATLTDAQNEILAGIGKLRDLKENDQILS